ncbi:MAG: hypothetical protein ACOC7P_01970 [Chloroflexota bacterium]
MPRKKSHSGIVRGEVVHEKYSARAQLDSEEALNLIRHVAEALTYSDGVVIEPHWGRRGGENNLHRIDVRSV